MNLLSIFDSDAGVTNGFADTSGQAPASSDSWSAITDAQSKIAELFDTQQAVDKAISAMPAGPDKTRLAQLRDENRGFFSTTILPAWNKLKATLGIVESTPLGTAPQEGGFGLLPLIPIAAVVAATALLGYVTKSLVVEYQILKDPALTASQKTQLLASGGFGGISQMLAEMKWVLLIGGAGYVAYQVMKAKRGSLR